MVEAIKEIHKIELPEEYYKMCYLLQTVEQIQANEKEETENYLKTTLEIFSEEMKRIGQTENEEKRNLCSEASVVIKEYLLMIDLLLKNGLLTTNLPMKM